MNVHEQILLQMQAISNLQQASLESRYKKPPMTLESIAITAPRSASEALFDSSNKFRQLPCKTFISVGTCPYRERCVYLHDPRCIARNVKTKTRKKNKEDSVVDTLFWPVMPYNLVRNKVDNQNQPHVIQAYSVPSPQNDQYKLHDTAVYSMWMHFIEFCLMNSESQGYKSPSECPLYNSSNAPINPYTNSKRLDIFVQLAQPQPMAATTLVASESSVSISLPVRSVTPLSSSNGLIGSHLNQSDESKPVDISSFLLSDSPSFWGRHRCDSISTLEGRPYELDSFRNRANSFSTLDIIESSLEQMVIEHEFDSIDHFEDALHSEIPSRRASKHSSGTSSPHLLSREGLLEASSLSKNSKSIDKNLGTKIDSFTSEEDSETDSFCSNYLQRHSMSSNEDEDLLNLSSLQQFEQSLVRLVGHSF